MVTMNDLKQLIDARLKVARTLHACEAGRHGARSDYALQLSGEIYGMESLLLFINNEHCAKDLARVYGFELELNAPDVSGESYCVISEYEDPHESFIEYETPSLEDAKNTARRYHYIGACRIMLVKRSEWDACNYNEIDYMED